MSTLKIEEDLHSEEKEEKIENLDNINIPQKKFRVLI